MNDIATIDLLNLAVLLLNAQGPEGIQAAGDAANLSHTVMNFDLPAIRKAGQPHPMINNQSWSLSFKTHVEAFEFLQELHQNFDPRLDST